MTRRLPELLTAVGAALDLDTSDLGLRLCTVLLLCPHGEHSADDDVVDADAHYPPVSALLVTSHSTAARGAFDEVRAAEAWT